MKIASESFATGDVIPARCAFGIPADKDHMQLGENRNPQLSWSDYPAETRSFVVLCVDVDVPSSAEDVNQEGKRIPYDLPRVDFAHWLMVDIPPDCNSLAEGEVSEGVTVGGKQAPDGPAGSRQGLNDYTGFLAGNADMAGDYLGYDGPCPPWNDDRVHEYQFTVYATDLEQCPVSGKFKLADVRAAIKGHVLAQATLTGEYSLNPEVVLPGRR